MYKNVYKICTRVDKLCHLNNQLAENNRTAKSLNRAPHLNIVKLVKFITLGSYKHEVRH